MTDESADELEGCRSWLQPQHLTDEAVQQYREQFAEHPARLLRITNVLLPDVAARLAAFICREAEFERVHGIVARPKKAPVEEWLAVEDARRLYTFDRLVNPLPEFRLSPNLLTYMKFRKDLESAAMRAYLRAVTGLPLGMLSAFNGQSFGVGDFLRPHRDTLDRRRLAFIFYLNPDWRPEFGGELRVVDQAEGEYILPVEFNSLVFFDVDAHLYHEILPIHPTAGNERRLTLGGWYLDATKTPDPTGAIPKPHVTRPRHRRQ